MGAGLCTLRASVLTPDMPLFSVVRFLQILGGGDLRILCEDVQFTPDIPDMKIRTWCLENIPFDFIALVQIRT